MIFKQRGKHFGAAVRVRCGPLRGFQDSNGHVYVFKDSSMKRQAFRQSQSREGLLYIGPGWGGDGLSEFLEPATGRRLWLGRGSSGELYHTSEQWRLFNRLRILSGIYHTPGVSPSIDSSGLLILSRGGRSIRLGCPSVAIFRSVIADLFGRIVFDESQRVYVFASDS